MKFITVALLVLIIWNGQMRTGKNQPSIFSDDFWRIWANRNTVMLTDAVICEEYEEDVTSFFTARSAKLWIHSG